MLNDDELVEQIKNGDEQAAEELIKRYYASILRYCRWHCSSMEKAEDLTQETFYKLFKNISGYKGKRKFKAYLYTIANRLCIDESRKVPVYSLEDVRIRTEAIVMLGSCVLWAISSKFIPWVYATSAIGFWMIAFVMFGIFFVKEILFIVEMRKEGKLYGIIA